MKLTVSSFHFEASHGSALVRLPFGLGQFYAGFGDGASAVWGPDRWRGLERSRGELFLRLGRLFLIVTPQRAIDQARWRRRTRG